MTKQEALDYIFEHLTKLHSNPNIYEDGTCNVINALEEHVIPIMKREIKTDEILESILEKDPHAFDRVNPVTPEELKSIMEIGENIC